MTRLACIGGFLGAGKTTALIAAARQLIARGIRVGVITNDQGDHLVDTALVRQAGLPAQEITGGCFCCRFADFVSHASHLVARHQPEIILAEAVGSCADLAATVYEPLRRFHAADFALAPLSVFVEPARIRDLLGPSTPFDDSVRYLFQKQLAEADLIILSKSDLLDPAQIAGLERRIRQVAGAVPLIVTSAKTDVGIAEWVSLLLDARSRRNRDLDVDYDLYGRAEASLGWLNATLDLASETEFLPAEWGEAVVGAIQAESVAGDAAIAHVKVLLVTAHGSDRIGLTTNPVHAQWDGAAPLAPVREASAIINARVATAPETLRSIVEHALESTTRESGIQATVLHMESFAPEPPKRPIVAATT